MPFPISLSQQNYEALVALAREGTKNPDGTLNSDLSRKLESFLRFIEAGSDIDRHFLWVQWQEADQPLPPSAQFPDKWPPELRTSIELTTRPIAKADVDAVLAKKARTPMNVLVTKDPAGIIGWSQPEVFFLT